MSLNKRHVFFDMSRYIRELHRWHDDEDWHRQHETRCTRWFRMRRNEGPAPRSSPRLPPSLLLPVGSPPPSSIPGGLPPSLLLPPPLPPHFLSKHAVNVLRQDKKERPA